MRDDQVEIGEFLAARGAPFYELQVKLKLLREPSLHSCRRAVIFVSLAWGVPLLFSLLEGRAFGSSSEQPYLLDVGTWARFLIAIFAFTISESYVEDQLRQTLRHFAQTPLLSTRSLSAAERAVSTAIKQRDSRLAEAACVALAIVPSAWSLIDLSQAHAQSWAVTVSSNGNSLTAAGWWCLLFSNTFFFFLLFRGLWRHFVWAALMRRIAALELRLVATHPDGKGGLSFLGTYPGAYTIFVFGISTVVGAGLADELVQQTISVTLYGYVMCFWLALVLGVFVYPLLTFATPLAELKRSTLLQSSAKGTTFQRQAERKVLGTNVVAASPDEADDQGEVSDPAKLFDATSKMSTLLLDRSAILPVGAAALLPLVAAGATRLPFDELLAISKKLLLL